VRDGYFVASGLVDVADVDAMIGVLDGLWDAPAPIASLTLLDLRERPTRRAEPAARRRARAAGGRALAHARRLGLAHPRVPLRRRGGRALFHHRGLRGLVSRLLGRAARPFAAINFMSGSQQHLHQDMAVFHIYPHDYLVGAWIACEDISPESGPLVLHAGSHQRRDVPRLSGLSADEPAHGGRRTTRAYEAWIDDVATRHPRHEFLAKKGDVLFWHGMLLHGGAPVLRRGISRKSMVLHYTVRGADRAREVRGPFNW
jgi:hypothetical protein